MGEVRRELTELLLRQAYTQPGSWRCSPDVQPMDDVCQRCNEVANLLAPVLQTKQLSIALLQLLLTLVLFVLKALQTS